MEGLVGIRYYNPYITFYSIVPYSLRASKKFELAAIVVMELMGELGSEHSIVIGVGFSFSRLGWGEP